MENPKSNIQNHIVKPKAPGFFTMFIIFSIPGFLTGLVWLLASLILVFGAIAASFGDSNQEEYIIEFQKTRTSSKTEKGILIYDLTGAIQSGNQNTPEYLRENEIYTSIVKKDFELIKEREDIKGVVFRLNTPGGTVYAAQELGLLIQDLLKDKSQKQAVYHFDQLAASGGLWASYMSENNYIYGSQYGLTGSIGVIMTIPNLSELAENIGYDQTVIKSGTNKGIGDIFEPVTPEQTNFLQTQVNDIYEDFIAVVSKARGLSIDEVRVIADGNTYTNEQAVANGLIDEIGNTQDAVSKAAEIKNLGKDYNIWEVNTEIPFLGSLFGSQSLAKIFGFSNSSKVVDRIFSMEPGRPYLIDPNSGF